MSEVWTESQPLLSVRVIGHVADSHIMWATRLRHSCQYYKGYHSNVRTEVADNRGHPTLYHRCTVHVPAKLPQVQLCRHASGKDLQCSHSQHWSQTVCQARPPCMRQVEQQHMRTKFCVSSVFMYTYLPGLNASRNQLLFVISSSLPWKTTGLL